MLLRWRAAARLGVLNRRSFCLNPGSKPEGPKSTAHGVPDSQKHNAEDHEAKEPCGDGESQIDGFEKLKNWNLMSRLVEAIRAGQNDKAMELLPDLSKYEMLTATSCNEFLYQCSLAGNFQLARQIIRFMKELGMETNERCDTHLLGAMSRAGNLDEAMEMLESATGGDGVDYVFMFNSVLNGCASAGSSIHADKCLKLMTSRKVEKNQQTYIELLRLAGKKQDLSLTKSLWIELKSIYSPSFNSYRTYIISLCRGSDLGEALIILQEMLDHIAEEMKLSESIPPAVTEVFNAIISTAGKTGQYQLAEMMFSEMNRMEIPVTIVTYDAVIRAVVKGRGVEYGLKLVQNMESRGIEPDSAIYGAIVECYCRNSELDKAENLLEQMLKAKPSQRPTAHAFNFIFQACSLTNEQDRALRVLRTMKTARVPPDICTYTALFCNFGSVSVPYAGGDQSSHEDLTSRLGALEADMLASGIQHSRQSLTALMRGLGSEGMLGPALKRLLNAEAFSAEDGAPFLDAFAYNTAMYSCIMFDQFSEAKELFTRMSAKNLKPNLHSYNIMIYGCLRSKDVTYANELLKRLQDNGLSPDSVTYNSLIKVLCAANELESALEVIQTMDRTGIEADIYSFNTIIGAAAVRGRIDMIEFLIDDMKDRNIPPNSYTILKVMITYIYLKRLDDAIEAVRTLSSRMLEGASSSGKSTIQSAVEVLMQDNSELVSEMTESLGKTIEETGDPEAQALYTLNLASLAAGTDEKWASEKNS
ncbi:hypothetical protein SELMODRAFT_445481 [Selaginella moellendorffii]|uniref:Pentatricopeptide repeat-containing protein-mitochondrial domain-containing protein n=2 Tax=Selaginella moellendorffii TaxID=88036 RepID=D8SIZ1_SELML|nr:pentatricopeptide repeat-containing protein At1g76280 isoform X1 [Selaginella moellendorffii]EFJ15708.1 hypothetical protein SELMODRAFT_445481 [Selaginella moellendorffii]|eukprot:XP_002983366.1 pentatricopeptide repeat-containing protein At1g76280 isoform X1 [Selaginella moellendorffii]